MAVLVTRSVHTVPYGLSEDLCYDTPVHTLLLVPLRLSTFSVSIVRVSDFDRGEMHKCMYSSDGNRQTYLCGKIHMQAVVLSIH